LKIRGQIRAAVEDSLRKLGLDGEGIPVVLERPREAAHGDMSTPVAMALAKKLRRNPNEIAGEIVSSLSLPEQSVASVAVLKPGFINFRFADAALRDNVSVVIRDGDRYGSSGAGGGDHRVPVVGNGRSSNTFRPTRRVRWSWYPPARRRWGRPSSTC